jgi:hypothetical protein
VLICRVRSLFLVNLKYGISMFLLVIYVNHTNTIFKVSLWILLTRKSLVLAANYVMQIVLVSFRDSPISSLSLILSSLSWLVLYSLKTYANTRDNRRLSVNNSIHISTIPRLLTTRFNIQLLLMLLVLSQMVLRYTRVVNGQGLVLRTSE